MNSWLVLSCVRRSKHHTFPSIRTFALSASFPALFHQVLRTRVQDLGAPQWCTGRRITNLEPLISIDRLLLREERWLQGFRLCERVFDGFCQAHGPHRMTSDTELVNSLHHATFERHIADNRRDSEGFHARLRKRRTFDLRASVKVRPCRMRATLA